MLNAVQEQQSLQLRMEFSLLVQAERDSLLELCAQLKADVAAGNATITAQEKLLVEHQEKYAQMTADLQQVSERVAFDPLQLTVVYRR